MSRESVHCPYCGIRFEKNPDEYLCEGCGKLPGEIKEEILSASEKQIECKKCGAMIGSKDKYCKVCGAVVSN